MANALIATKLFSWEGEKKTKERGWGRWERWGKIEGKGHPRGESRHCLGGPSRDGIHRLALLVQSHCFFFLLSLLIWFALLAPPLAIGADLVPTFSGSVS